jgi:hypothetical protein
MKRQPAWIATFTLIAITLFAALPLAAEAKAGSLLPDATYSGTSGAALGSPFPMAANPAINTGDHSLLPDQKELPSAMSSNVSSSKTDYELGSAFPMAANPAGHNKLKDVSEGADFSRGSVFADTASPFPTAAAPARSHAR